MPTSLFSTYSTGENRVTASFLAVLRSLSLDRIERLLGALLEQSEFELVRFENQPSKGGKGVPDAIIQSNCRILIKTKIQRNAVSPTQIERHLKRLDDAGETRAVLLIMTPDETLPGELSSANDERLVWASFAALDQSIDEILDDKQEVISERETFLLRELQSMLVAENLLASANDVVVVPARNAWPEYKSFHAYVCQPDRPFQQVSRMAFYAGGEIQPLIPKILTVYERLEFSSGNLPGALSQLVARFVATGRRKEGAAYKVFVLSDPDAPDTIRLDRPVPNDLRSKSGRITEFTQNQRYVALSRLKEAKTTSDLV